MRLGVLLIGLGLALAPWAAGAEDRPVQCELTIRGQTYIQGLCQFRPGQGGSFTITGGDYFAYVGVHAPGRAEASWNGAAGATHAHAPLGALRREGACWVGPEVRICARSLSPEAERAAVAAQPGGFGLFPEAALQACLGVEGEIAEGASLVLRDCRLPADLIFQRAADGSLGLAGRPELCLDLEGPGMGRPPVVTLLACGPDSPRWRTRADSVEAAPVESAAGLCLVIPQMDEPGARFPFRVEALPCAAAGDRAVRFVFSRG